MDSPNSRLREARIRAGFKTAREAYEKFGWNPNTYRAHESGPREYNKKNAFQYAHAFSVDVVWLLTGVHAAGHEKRTGETYDETIQGANRAVPVLRVGAIQQMLSRNPYEISAAKVDTIACDADLPPYAFAVEANDDSMNDGSVGAILPGDQILLKPDVDPTPGQIVGAIIKGDPTMLIRRFAQAPQGENGMERFRLQAANTNWQPRTVAKSDVLLMWPMIQLTRKF